MNEPLSLTQKVRGMLAAHTEEGILNVLISQTSGGRWPVIRAAAEAGLSYLRAKQSGMTPRIQVVV